MTGGRRTGGAADPVEASDQTAARVAKKYASSVDVARAAGVSQSAVSRAFSGAQKISETTRRRIFEAAEQLDYRPSLIPRIMLTHRSNLVAIVAGGLYNPYYSAVLEQLTIRFQDAGQQVLLVHVDSDHAIDAVIPRLASYRVDAVVSALAILSPSAATMLSKLKIPVISFNTALQSDWVIPISSGNVEAGHEIADLFVRRGARSFGFISGPGASFASRGRLDGFEGRLRELDAGPVDVVRSDYRYEGGHAAALDLFGKGRTPEAIFCANDLLAIGAMDALRHTLGLRVPLDVMIAGFDDIPEAAWASYGLTTFVQDSARMAEAALQLVLSAGSSTSTQSVAIAAPLVERRTTRASL